MESSAWLLKDTSGEYFSVCDVEMVEYIPDATLFFVPLTPKYCKQVIAWREQLLPVVDLALVFNKKNSIVTQQVGIFAYQLEENSQLNYVAILLQESPLHIEVNDSQFCELPLHYSGDKLALALSCFLHMEHVVPILNINYLCSNELKNNIENCADLENELEFVIN